MKSFLFSVRAFQNVTFSSCTGMSHFHVQTSTLSHSCFNMYIIKVWEDQLNLTRHVMKLHSYAAFDLPIDILDGKPCNNNKKKESYPICMMYSIYQNVSFCSLSYANVIFNTGFSDSFHAPDCSWLIYFVTKSLSTFKTSLPVSYRILHGI